jgi:pimeloyl-ACP methyl ester carboxylesterase
MPIAAAPSPEPSRVVENPVLRVEVTGEGRPMLLLPGLTCGADVWRDAVAHFAGRYQCHAVTLGGFAGKPRFEGPFLDTVRDSLLAYLRAARLEDPVIVGHSLGGVLAMEMAIARPDAIGPLVIVDALPFMGAAGDSTATEESARKSMEPMRRMIAGQTQEAYAAFQRQAPWLRGMVAPGPNLDRVVEWAATSDRIAVADAMFEIGTRDLRPKVGAVRSPMLVLGSWYGMKDFTTRPAVEATFRSQYAKAPRWTLAVADTARHFVMLDSPGWTWAQMESFLAAQ